ncbi:hypothetical protein GCM10007940_36980 [Portibacter lacus]|uniref:Uncharacterized protein n=2 Tax=Portibacter lacus TaxID=1099794 RepID=A0AA37SRR8_9BACT|nr:hypothetical protein GCM10007940_36980 [Portibacter lacus]
MSTSNSYMNGLNLEATYEVGSDIVLKFSKVAGESPLIYLTSSYGSTVLSPEEKDNEIWYRLPSNISDKIGVVRWKCLSEGDELTGKFTLEPINTVASLETYIGPPSIEAGGTDYTMMVVIPTDSLDNPLPQNTLVNVQHQFLEVEESEEVATKHLIAFQNLYSKRESGRMLVSSSCLGEDSKEFSINVAAAIPVDFSISAHRPHHYADGNQITTFSTSIIRDKHDNVVSDGTYVNFLIANADGNTLSSSGTTLSGIATAKMIHPEKAETWRVTAMIDGIAESNSVVLDYEQVIEDFELTFSDHNRALTVGPLQSFMGQMIPDGLQVKLFIYKDDQLLEIIPKTSVEGYVIFYLEEDIYKNGDYRFQIQAAGMDKKIDNIKLW